MSNAQENELIDQFEQFNEAFADSIERNVEAQTALVTAMTDSFIDSIPEEEEFADGVEGYAKASEVWVEATEQLFEEMTDTVEGGGVNPEAIRDILVQASNEALSEVMSSSAFATMDGNAVEQITERQRELQEMTEDSLAQAGMATQSDVSEVAKRLVELERRQHAVERKVDRILEAVE